MDRLLKDVLVWRAGGGERRDLVLSGHRLLFDPAQWPDAPLEPFIGQDLHLFPGFTDVHVHLREPGFSYKETMESGTLAAAHGGFATVCAMPNLDPVPDSMETLQVQLALIARSARVRVLPYGAITTGQKGLQLADLSGMAPWVAGFSDDGRGVQGGTMMEQAMRACAELDKVLAAHCEDEALTQGGWIHQGDWAKAHGHQGIPSMSEWRQVARDLALAEKTRCRYHVCHVSARESVALIRDAKARGVDVTCETAPHYLVLDDSLLEDAGRFKINPPIRARADRDALVAGLADGTIDMVATDHAPHSAEEKARGLAGSVNGAVGLETAFPVLYTALVRSGLIRLEQLVDALSTRPNARFGISGEGDWTLFDLGSAYRVDPAGFLSKGRASPFEGMAVYGRCLMTLAQGRMAYLDPRLPEGGNAV